jgi:uncharacterized protein (TIGR03086 family)
VTQPPEDGLSLDPEQQDVLSLHTQALATFGRAVRAVLPDQWVAPTPCTEWSVWDLVNHMTSEQLWVPALLDGASIDDVGDRYSGDVLDGDPAAAWFAAAAGARDAFSSPGALERTVHLSSGPTRAMHYCKQMTVDATVHAWDLAKAIGADTSLAARLVTFSMQEVEPHVHGLADSGLFAPSIKVDKRADEQTKLLALLGRRDDDAH